MYTHIYTHTQTYTHTYTHTHTHTYNRLCRRSVLAFGGAFMSTFIYVQIDMYTYIHTSIPAHI